MFHTSLVLRLLKFHNYSYTNWGIVEKQIFLPSQTFLTYELNLEVLF